ncbi:MAG: ATP-binding protein [Bacillota bacterium]
MRQLVILSGKGGTGKTSLTASFARLADEDLVMADCDVDAPDLHFLMQPEVRETHEFASSALAEIDPDICTECGLCREHCRFDAIDEDFRVDDIACEGCYLCYHVCPVDAITMHPKVSGHWYRSDTSSGPMIHARLSFGEGNSGKLVTRVKEEARRVAEEAGRDTLLVDGPPGIGCPVIAALSGATRALLVTEPSSSGLHDLRKIAAVCRHFGVPAGICINRYDVYQDYTDRIEEMAREEDLPVVGRIPYDENVTWAQLEGKTIVEYDDGPASRAIKKVWEDVFAGLDR